MLLEVVLGIIKFLIEWVFISLFNKIINWFKWIYKLSIESKSKLCCLSFSFNNLVLESLFEGLKICCLIGVMLIYKINEDDFDEDDLIIKEI